MHPSNLRAVIVGAETFIPAERELMESAFKCKMVNKYASREFLEIAQDCPDTDNGLHVNTESVFLEVVKENGQWVSRGERGKILVTDLHNWVMPFIRYHLCDYVIWGGQCSCGRGFPLLRSIQGRSVEYLVTPSGKSPSCTDLTHVMRDYTASIREYQAVQGKIDEVEFLVVPEKVFDSSIEARLRAGLEDFLDHEVKIHIRVVPQIELDEASGKRSSIKSQLPPRQHEEG